MLTRLDSARFIAQKRDVAKRRISPNFNRMPEKDTAVSPPAAEITL